MKVQITPAMLAAAQQKAEQLKTLNSNSFFGATGTLIGALGEQMVLSVVPKFSYKDTSTYDFDLDGFRWDCKTKYQTVKCDPVTSGFAAAVKAHQRDYETDHYIFCRVYRDPSGAYTQGWICGWIEKYLIVPSLLQTPVANGIFDLADSFFEHYSVTIDEFDNISFDYETRYCSFEAFAIGTIYVRLSPSALTSGSHFHFDDTRQAHQIELAV